MGGAAWAAANPRGERPLGLVTQGGLVMEGVQAHTEGSVSLSGVLAGEQACLLGQVGSYVPILAMFSRGFLRYPDEHKTGVDCQG